MVKELSQLTLQELWVLFPIILKEYNDDYPKWYSGIKTSIINCVGKLNCKRINHIGSTAVKGLLSKPTIDILLEIKKTCSIDDVSKKLKNDGWILMKSSKNPYLNYVFNKGYTKNGFADKVYHLHIRNFGNWNELYFKDLLIDDKNVAAEYERLKLKLIKLYKNNRDSYTNAKSEFIAKYAKQACELYKDRYK